MTVVRILWVLPYLPWPTTSGGKTRQYHLLKNLAAQGAQITLLVQSKQPLDEQVQAALTPFLERLIVLPRRSLRHPVTLTMALFGRWPLLTCINGFSPPLTRCFDALLEEHWDVVQIEHSYSLQPYIKVLAQRQQRFILTEHNLESSLGGATYNRFPRWAKPFVMWDQWRARRWEKEAFAVAERIIAVTEEDAQAIQMLTQTPVDVVVNGVDCSAFSDVTPAVDEKRILFLGNYEYPPNVDAVFWMLDEVMPKVWLQSPAAKFAIAGYAMPQHWAQRWPDERIEWHGFVQDLTALQRSSSVFVAPLRDGGGSKLKVLEAMAAGLPLVATQQGVSGLTVSSGQEYLHAENTAELAAALNEVLLAADKANALGEAARDYVLQHHDWSAAVEQLKSTYQVCMGEQL